jgi:hypothetical protein
MEQSVENANNFGPGNPASSMKDNNVTMLNWKVAMKKFSAWLPIYFRPA